jgi:CBS domain-containing protein
VQTCAPHDTLLDIAESMIAQDIRHLPVVDGDEIVDMISMRDLFVVFEGKIKYAAA